jgi:PIN domain nuclease of toxin-antitoxin system
VRLLLDTHIWLWSLLAPERLARRVVKALEDSENELWLSAISTWELVVLVERKRVILDEPVDVWVADAFRTAPLREAPLTHEIALVSGKIVMPHRDPADRLITATARVLGLTLVTADDRILDAAPVPTLANR